MAVTLQDCEKIEVTTSMERVNTLLSDSWIILEKERVEREGKSLIEFTVGKPRDGRHPNQSNLSWCFW